MCALVTGTPSSTGPETSGAARPDGAPWPAGSATGIGSLPGTDPDEALRLVFGELPDFPYLPELPDRGPGAELTGRTAGLLVGMPVELYAARWRLASRPGRDLRRTGDLLARDLDALLDVADGYTGVVKVAAGGPWTLAAVLELPVGGRVLRDAGAVRDLTESLAEGLREHVAQVAARVPAGRVLLQLDEPSLPAVLAGHIATESGLGVLRAPEESVAEQALRTVIETVGVPVVVHCCAPSVPVGLIRAAGAVGVSVDFDVYPGANAAALDELGEALDAGFGLLAGVVPATGSDKPADSAGPAARISELWHRLGFPLARLPEQVVVTPACGMAGATPDYARAAMVTCREAARRLQDQAAE